ncbi:MAG: signal peptidase II [Opitutales bacterium]|nr:signal peptidase II [Opitutales bacterium]
MWTVLVSILVLDQWSKSWVVERAVELRRNPIVLIDSLEGPEAFLEFTYVTNPGAAWSLFSDYPEALTLLAGIALASIFVFRRHLELHRNSLQFVFGAIAGGIAGNLGDRIFRDPAAVVDFIDVFLPWVEYDYPIFNVADSAIFIGAFSYLIIGFLDSKTKDNGQKNILV